MASSPTDPDETIAQQAIIWHTRVTSREMGHAERAQFNAWLAEDSRHGQAYRDIGQLWQRLGQPLQADHQQRQMLKQASGASIRKHAEPKRRLRHWQLGLAVAASLLLLILGIYPDYLAYPLADYRTRIGEQSQVTLADGSVLHLNTDTALNVVINNQERRIELLHGEAEFDVAHDRNRPFRVQAGATTTEALGTHFVVRYDGSQGMTTLLSGKVRTTQANASLSEVILKPGQRVSFSPSNLATLETADMNAATAWRRDRLVMNFVSVAEVIAELNRYRRGTVKLMDNTLAQRQINAVIDLKQIDDWLATLPKTLPVHVYRVGPLVVLD